MSRFSWNRHWTLILALAVCLASSAITIRPVCADPIQETAGDVPGGEGGQNGLGDPDVPDGPGRNNKVIKSGYFGRGSTNYGVGVAGDDGTYSGWMGRLSVAWLGLRGMWFRF